MKIVISFELKTTPWIPGIINPVRPGYYQRDRRTRVPSERQYIAPEDGARFIAEYPSADASPPAIGISIDLEYWDGKQWLLDRLSRTPSYVGSGKEKCYWRGIGFDANIHQSPFNGGLLIIEGP